MSGRDIALTGVPRGGTTLACQLLGRCAGTVALFEPMEVMQLPVDRADAVASVEAFFAHARQTLQRDGRAPSKQRDGQVPDNPFGGRDASGRRELLATPGTLRVAPPAPGFTLVVKHNAAFAALLPQLRDAIETYAVVRNPMAVLASWQSVELPVTQGHAPAGERLDPVLAQELLRHPTVAARQLELLDWFFARFAAHLPPERVLRYEDIVASGGALLQSRVGLAPAPDGAMSTRNANALYRGMDADTLDALLARPGAWRAWYPDDELAAAASALRGVGP